MSVQQSQGGHDLTEDVSLARRDHNFDRKTYGHAHPLSQAILDSKSTVSGAAQQIAGEYITPSCGSNPS